MEMFIVGAHRFNDDEDFQGEHHYVRIMAEYHIQHIYSKTKLAGVSESGSRKLDSFFSNHPREDGWEITLDVPGTPRLVGYTTGMES